MDSGRDVLDVGAVLGETYRIEGLIGRGGMGAVWAAEHLRLPGKHVAVKVLLDATAGGQEMFQRFRREAEIASRLGHPNIVEVLDFNTLPSGQPYIVLEYLHGETLASRLAAGRILLDEALAISRQIGSALQAAHRAGVVHRDLKPDNVFLCTPEEDVPTKVKVLDFGISKIRGSQTLRTQDAILMGTPQYMSPEQATGKNADLDGRTDVWALGAIVYEMLGGQPAFAGGSLAEVVYRVVHAQPTPLRELAPALPDTVVAAVEHALQKDPAARPVDVGTFVLRLTGRPLHGFSTGQPVGIEATRLTPRSASALGAGTGLGPTHTPSARVPTSPWPPGSAPVAPLVPSGVVTAPPTPLAPAPRARSRLALVLVALAALGIGAGGVALLGRRGPAGPPLPALATSTRAGPDSKPLAPLEPTAGIEVPPSPPRDPGPAAASEKPGHGATPHHLAHVGARQGAVHAAAKEPAGPAAKEPVTPAKEMVVAEAPREPAGAPAATDSVKPETRRLLEQAEDALRQNKPLDAIRLVDQSFYVQKTSLGYAIQARAACMRRDVGGAKAAFRNVTDPEMKRAVLGVCVRQDVWLFR